MIIGISGLAGSGKDTAANRLVKAHDFVKVAFADEIKRICKTVFDFTDEQLWGSSELRNKPDCRYVRMKKGGLGTTIKDWNDDKKTYNTVPSPEEDIYLTPRHALQQLGTEFGRSCYQNVWVEYTLRIVKNLLAEDRRKPNMVNYYSPQNGLMFVGGLSKPKNVVIPDVRFKNEIDAIHSAKGLIIRMLRGSGLEGVAGEHSSETEQCGLDNDSFDIVIDNREWNHEQLYSYIDQIVWRHIGKYP